MDRNYCFRRKRHSYAAFDAALAASIYIYIYIYTTHNLIASRDDVNNYEFKGNNCVQISLGYLVGDDHDERFW